MGCYGLQDDRNHPRRSNGDLVSSIPAELLLASPIWIVNYLCETSMFVMGVINDWDGLTWGASGDLGAERVYHIAYVIMWYR